MPGAVHIDGEDADYHTNPTSVDIDEFLVDGNTLLASMIEGGDRLSACNLLREREG